MTPLAELAARLGGVLPTPTAAVVSALALHATAGPEDLSFPLDVTVAAGCNAGGILVRSPAESPPGVPVIIVPDPLLACARAAAWLPVRRPADTDTACVQPGAAVAENCVLSAGVWVGEGTRIAPGCVLGRGARIGAYCDIGPGVTIGAGVRIGNRVRIAAGAVLAGDAFMAIRDGPCWVRFPAFAAVVIEDDVRIGCNVTLARGVFTDTRIGARTMLDAQVHVGHDTTIEADTMLAAGVTLGGSVRVGQGCVLCGRVAVSEGVTIARGVVVDAASLVCRSIVDEGTRWSSSWPAERRLTWWRGVAALRRRSQRNPR